MKSKTVAVVAAVSLCFGGPALGQGRGDRDHPGDHRPPAHRPAPKPPMRVAAHPGERGIGPNHEFHRGQRIAVQYRHRNYVVDNWRAHHLTQPPRGYHWVQVGADYALIAITTGVILNVLLGN